MNFGTFGIQIKIVFLESTSNKAEKKGWIEVICGCMFSGKTEELIRRMKRAEFAQQKVEIFKPLVDQRYSETKVVSHDNNAIPSTAINHSSQILLLSNDIEVVGIDEAQFFDEGLPEVCTQLANQGVRVIIAGLDLDYLGRPFGPMPQLLALAEFVTKVHAICVKTGKLAHHSYRMASNEGLVHIGEKESYLPLSRQAFQEAMAEKKKGNGSKIDQELLAFVDNMERRKEETRKRREELLRSDEEDLKDDYKPHGTAELDFE